MTADRTLCLVFELASKPLPAQQFMRYYKSRGQKRERKEFKDLVFVSFVWITLISRSEAYANIQGAWRCHQAHQVRISRSHVPP
ncbi:hypothetical protein TSTA_056030 [Talaromyces stipitatus ATCC 10500]|uniref:Uncharacterized protein n=1 Tax=Talaromyces stipitatus (strain ATCC 10500 / CBS 375.48 / QM 6759 / NRRL 1006) TaxID=441959 RepID=B8MRG6_TALSN|nr:uncharacterized protein TSTA_056030 [Talaromyces stipitatus ATCC 10500]EED13103.1 hypothetical protein TSTA_056030 [Talaromyces stipitatus ATCC 10500]